MIRNKTKPTKVCTGTQYNRYCRIKDIIVEPDVQLVPLRNEKEEARLLKEGKRIITKKKKKKHQTIYYKVIPLKKNISIVRKGKVIEPHSITHPRDLGVEDPDGWENEESDEEWWNINESAINEMNIKKENETTLQKIETKLMEMASTGHSTTIKKENCTGNFSETPKKPDYGLITMTSGEQSKTAIKQENFETEFSVGNCEGSDKNNCNSTTKEENIFDLNSISIVKHEKLPESNANMNSLILGVEEMINRKRKLDEDQNKNNLKEHDYANGNLIEIENHSLCKRRCKEKGRRTIMIDPIRLKKKNYKSCREYDDSKKQQTSFTPPRKDSVASQIIKAAINKTESYLANKDSITYGIKEEIENKNNFTEVGIITNQDGAMFHMETDLQNNLTI